MTSIPRPGLEDAARAWLSDPARDDAPEWLVTALSDFVEKRFRGAASVLRAAHQIRQDLLASETWQSAAQASAPSDQGRLLFHLARDSRARRILELGTNIGISSIYLALGLRYGGGGTVFSLEQSEPRMEQARRIHDEIDVTEVEIVAGAFDDVLPGVLNRLETVNLAFLDGNHQRDATIRYYEMLLPHMPTGSLMILDDIRWSEGMLEAWTTLRSRPENMTTVDLGRTGLILMA